MVRFVMMRLPVVALAGLVLFIACTDLLGPGDIDGNVQLVVQPSFGEVPATAAADNPAARVDNVRLLLVNAGGVVVIDTIVEWPLHQDTLRLELAVPVRGQERFELTIQARSGSQVLFQAGPMPLDLAVNTVPVIATPVLEYAGPGSEVASVSIGGAPATFLAGSAVQLTAVGMDGGGDAIDGFLVIWTSLEDEAATVDAAGVVRVGHDASRAVSIEARVAYTAITATVGGPVVPASLTLSPGADTLRALGSELALSAAPLGADGAGVTGVAVEWSVVDTSVVSIRADGGAAVATAVGPGSTRVIAMAGPVVDSADVVVVQAVARLSLDPDSAVFESVGGSLQAVAEAFDANDHPAEGAPLQWTSQAEGVATVGGDGLITAVRPGTTWIVVSAAAAADSMHVTVLNTPPALAILAPADGAEFREGELIHFEGSAEDLEDGDLSEVIDWRTEAGLELGSGASVSITLEPGAHTIVATVADLNGALVWETIQVTVRSATPSRLAFGQQPTRTGVGETVTPAVTVRIEDAHGNLVAEAAHEVTLALGNDPAEGATLSGTLTRPAVSGLVTFDDLAIDRRASGYTLSATAAELAAAQSQPFDIVLVVYTVTISPAVASVAPGGSVTFAASALTAEGDPVQDASCVWSSSDPAIAVIDAGGTATGSAEGQVTIRVECDGVPATATLQVATVAARPDPYEPNDSYPYFNVDGLVSIDPALNAAGGHNGVPFRTVDSELGVAAIGYAGDRDGFTFAWPATRALGLTVRFVSDAAPLRITLENDSTFEVWLRDLRVPAFGEVGAVINLAGQSQMNVIIDAPAAADTARPAYVLTLDATDAAFHDYLNGDTSNSLEPNDFSTFPGANRATALPYDVVGTVGGAGAMDVDLFRVPALAGTGIRVDLDSRDPAETLTAALYRRGPDGRLDPVAGAGVSLAGGASGSFQATLGTDAYYVAITGGGRYDLCVRETWGQCRTLSIDLEDRFIQPVGYAGQLLADSLVVIAYGELLWGEVLETPVPGALVKFAAAEGSLSATEVMTDHNGRAAVAYTLPTTPGVYEVKAWVTGAHAGYDFREDPDSLVLSVLAAEPIDGLTFGQVSAGGGHTCAIAADGAAFCWGENTRGILGIGATIDVPLPVRVAGGHAFSTISTGELATCGIATDGALYCWGDSYFNGAGLGDDAYEPVPVAPHLRFRSVALGSWHACAVTTDGDVYCWGDAYGGALGNGATTGGEYTPVRAHLDVPVVEVVSGIWFSCARTDAGIAYCWGIAGSGQVGSTNYETCTVYSGSVPCNKTPKLVNTELAFTALGAGDWHACGSTSVALYCWGDNGVGQIGITAQSPYKVYTPAPVQVEGSFRNVDGGEYFTCGARADGTGLCWGDNGSHQLGVDTYTLPEWWTDTPIHVSGGHSFTMVATGTEHSCGITSAGRILCWGWNGAGQLGTGTFTRERYPPTFVGGPAVDAAGSPPGDTLERRVTPPGPVRPTLPDGVRGPPGR
jgi:alpha-tubulin suppressor-like RCC1 family protein